jgi:beta-glucosidase
VVQLYISRPSPPIPGPIRQLSGVERITLSPEEKKTVKFILRPRDLAAIAENGDCVLIPGEFTVSVGGSQPDARSEALTGVPVQRKNFTVRGEKRVLNY